MSAKRRANRNKQHQLQLFATKRIFVRLFLKSSFVPENHPDKFHLSLLVPSNLNL